MGTPRYVNLRNVGIVFGWVIILALEVLVPPTSYDLLGHSGGIWGES